MSTAIAAGPTSNTYNEIPYPGGAFRASHPSHIAMVAKLFSLAVAQPSKCRVLELGCSMGSNLIPMAEGLPDSQFIGIDYSETQIEQGRKVIADLGMTNIELKHLSILDVPEDLGEFDFIICHGVYSWVPRDVQDKILSIGKEYLAENGVMYVSYNTYPGWHFRGLVRDMMVYHVADIPSPRERVSQARGLLDFLVKFAKPQSEAYLTMLKEEAKMLNECGDSYLFHEHLEEVNEPFYFRDFVKRVDVAGLRYLGDSAVLTMVAQRFQEEAAEILRNAPLLRREQYMDFLRNRTFRGSLLCHQRLQPNYRIPSENLADLHVGLRQPLVKSEEDSGEVTWKSASAQLTTQGGITDIVNEINVKFPAWLSIRDLIGGGNDQARQVVLDILHMGFLRGIFDLAYEPVAISSEIGEKPRCSDYARYQARRGNTITSLNHHDLVVQPQQRFFIQRADGETTRDELVKGLVDECRNARFKITQEDGETVATDQLEKICSDELERLRSIAVFTG